MMIYTKLIIYASIILLILLPTTFSVEQVTEGIILMPGTIMFPELCKEGDLSLNINCNLVLDTFPVNDVFSCTAILKNDNPHKISIKENVALRLFSSIAYEGNNYEYYTDNIKVRFPITLDEEGFYVIEPGQTWNQTVEFTGRLFRLGDYRYIVKLVCEEEEYVISRLDGSFEVVPKSVYGQLKAQTEQLNELKASNKELISSNKKLISLNRDYMIASSFISFLGLVVAIYSVKKQKIEFKPKIEIKLNKELKKLFLESQKSREKKKNKLIPHPRR